MLIIKIAAEIIAVKIKRYSNEKLFVIIQQTKIITKKGIVIRHITLLKKNPN